MINPSSSDIWVSGSYDSTIKIWDMRTHNTGAVMNITVQHSETNQPQPVESLLVYPSGSLIAAAAGNELKIFDIVGGGRLLHSGSNHSKNITCLDMDITGTRLLTGALDRHVKVYDTKDFTLITTLSYPAPILSLALSVSSFFPLVHSFIHLERRTQNSY
jgi:U3 small nucleolar RNA-associated protein 15